MGLNNLVKTELGRIIFDNKYRHNNESYEEWLDRVSGGNKDIKNLIDQRKFLFAGRTLSNRGIGGSLSNCYSAGYAPDDLKGLLELNSQLGLTYKAQGGEGLSLSLIRPKGAKVGERFTSDGIVPFMKMYDTTTSVVSQAGSRKGALMMSLDIWHPEAETFITIKEDHDAINKANLSVEIDNDFMNSLEDGVECKIRTWTNGEIEIMQDVYPMKLFRQIAQSAWKSAEPGVLFTDNLRNYHIMQHHPEYKIITTNPCGEQPLPKHGACNISSINISEYVLYPFDNAIIDFDSLALDIKTIVRAMDDVLTENLPNHALEEQREVAINYRNIGIGVMGLADTFIKMELKYGSPGSILLVDKLMKFIFRQAVIASVDLAAELGSFPKYDPCVFDSDIMKYSFRKEELDEFRLKGLRNCSLLSIAPTGSIGTMLDVSTGIEPFFALKYSRKTESLMGEDAYFDVFPSIVQEYMDKFNCKFEDLPDYFVASDTIDPIDRIVVQGRAQRYVDTAISSTVNLPEKTTVEEIEEIYMQAWRHGLKGVTVYRDGSRAPILSRDGHKNEKSSGRPTIRPRSLEAEIHTVSSKGVKYNVFVGLLEGKPYEIFCQKEIVGIDLSSLDGFNIIKEAKGRYSFSASNGGIRIMLQENSAEERTHAILLSMLLRHGVDLGEIIKTAKKIDDNISSFSSAICRVLGKYIADGDTGEKCPECGGAILMTGGCKSCMSCGYSRCG